MLLRYIYIKPYNIIHTRFQMLQSVYFTLSQGHHYHQLYEFISVMYFLVSRIPHNVNMIDAGLV